METGHVDVSYVAELARLQLSLDETLQFQKQLDDILNYVQEISKVDVSQVPPHPIDPNLPTNALRADTLKESLSKDNALLNAPIRSNDLIVSPKIVE